MYNASREPRDEGLWLIGKPVPEYPVVIEIDKKRLVSFAILYT